MSTVLTRDEIFAAQDTRIEWVDVPEWGVGKGVFIRGLTGTDRDAFEMAMLDQKRDKRGRPTSQEINLTNLRAKLIVRTAVSTDDPVTAELIFRPSDVEMLGRKSGSALQRLYAVAQRLSGLSNEDVEELTKELGEDQSDGSGSDSQATSDTLPSLQPSEQ